ncbi:hypothetical protein [Nocardioides speluncae]|uniref:hypothetical protein n=1 Tax=Nocardioides speluncae TaxID=2670337 RepID=UPI001F0BDEC3|nr:hypothetical protein [Nocardioides speluncae]
MADDYCDFCDLPLSQCVHGQPPPLPTVKPPPKPKPKPRTPARTRTPGVPDKPVRRKWTPPEAFKPVILAVLQEAGGELPAEALFQELELRAADSLLPGDAETMPQGELRWQYAARRARLALIDEGSMTKGKPGVWELARKA